MQIDISAIVAIALLLAVIFLGWRSNRAPGLDHRLLKEHSHLKTRLTTVEEALKSCATRADVIALSGKIDALEEYAASAGDINALEGKVNVIGERVDGVRRSIIEMREDGKETRESLKVIERLLMKGALDK